jgi:hypothetical protein
MSARSPLRAYQLLDKILWTLPGEPESALVYDSYKFNVQFGNAQVKALDDGLKKLVRVGANPRRPPWYGDEVAPGLRLYSRVVRDFGRIWYTLAWWEGALRLLVLAGTLERVDFLDEAITAQRQAESAVVVELLRSTGQLY